MNFQSIRFKYTAAFLAVALVMAFSGIYSYVLISNLSKASNEFSHKFNPAISAILNADRDLYQARVAELNALLNPSEIDANRASYEENAQQAYDRWYVYQDLLANYPKILAKLEGFDTSFNAWKTQSSQVFSLLEQGKTAEAKALSEGNSNSSFGTLRDFYDLAGAEADETGLALGDSVIDYVDSRSTRVTIFLLLTVIAASALGIFAPRAMSNALKLLTSELAALNSGDGDLSRRIRSERKDEIGDVAHEIDVLFDGLSQLIRGIVSQSATVLENAVAMNDGAEGVRNTSQAQLESVEMIVTAVNEMSVAIKEVAQNAQFTASEINQVNTLCDQGKAITVDAVNQIKEVSTTVGNASQAMGELSESSDNIASVLDVIRGIAEQTNLLALNAAIEAARAGEQGRGFAVVADEVRSLASKTQQSTDDIQKMIEALQKGVKDAVSAIDQGLESVNSSVEKSESTNTALDSIIDAAKRVSDAATQIATSTEEQSHVAEDVNNNLVVLSDLGKTSFEHSSSNKQRASDVTEVTEQLSASVTRFKLD